MVVTVTFDEKGTKQVQSRVVLTFASAKILPESQRTILDFPRRYPDGSLPLGAGFAKHMIIAVQDQFDNLRCAQKCNSTSTQVCRLRLLMKQTTFISPSRVRVIPELHSLLQRLPVGIARNRRSAWSWYSWIFVRMVVTFLSHFLLPVPHLSCCCAKSLIPLCIRVDIVKHFVLRHCSEARPVNRPTTSFRAAGLSPPLRRNHLPRD